jgi:signal transduction histidine kinase
MRLPTVSPRLTSPVLTQRAIVHDLRNLFAVVASAKSLLARHFDERTKDAVLDALDRVATEGGALTTALLSGDDRARPRETDATAAISEIGTIIRTLVGPEVRVDLDLGSGPATVRMARANFQAVVLELAVNAQSAGARRLRLRSGLKGGEFWLVVADDGHGFGLPVQQELGHRYGAHGTGLARIAAAVRSAHGTLRIHSTPGRGSVIAVVLPAVLHRPRETPSASKPKPGRRAATS